MKAGQPARLFVIAHVHGMLTPLVATILIPAPLQFLCCWDHGLTLDNDVEDLMCTVGSNMATMIQVEKEKGNTLERTFEEKVKMAIRRGTGLLIFACILVASWTTIIFLTAQQNDLANKLKDQYPEIEFLAFNIVPGCVTAINTLLPIIIDLITKFEKWDSEKTVIKVLLMKMYLAKILNVLIQFVSYLLLANPILFTSDSKTYFGIEATSDSLRMNRIRDSVAIQFSDTFKCRLDHVAAGLVQLLTVDFVLSKVIASVMPYFKMIKAKVLKGTFKREEFAVAKKMVNLLYFQGLVFLTIPYAPLFTIVILAFHFLTFKFEKMMLFKFGAKPKKEWKAQDAGGFFIKFYLVTIIVTGLLSTFVFLSTDTFARDKLWMEVEHCADLPTSVSTCTILPIGYKQMENETFWNKARGELRKRENVSEARLELSNATETLFSISEKKCGPFIYEESVVNMLETDIAEFGLLSQLVYQLAVNALLVWFFVLLFLLVSKSDLGVVVLKCVKIKNPNPIPYSIQFTAEIQVRR